MNLLMMPSITSSAPPAIDARRPSRYMETLRYDLSDDGIATLTFDELGSPVNTMKLQWQHDLAEATDCLVRDKEKVRGVLLASAKSTFFAGAELKGVLKLKADDAAGGFAQIEALKRSFRRIETLGRPVVALLNGAALGGGWEVALVAHARFALDDRKIQFGMAGLLRSCRVSGPRLHLSNRYQRRY